MTKKVKVRVAVAVDEDGYWCAVGDSRSSEEDSMHYASHRVSNGENQFWLEAELEIPEFKTVQADVVEVKK